MESSTKTPSTARAAHDLLGPGMWRRKIERGQGELRWAVHAVYRQEREVTPGGGGNRPLIVTG